MPVVALLCSAAADGCLVHHHHRGGGRVLVLVGLEVVCGRGLLLADLADVQRPVEGVQALRVGQLALPLGLFQHQDQRFDGAHEELELVLPSLVIDLHGEAALVLQVPDVLVLHLRLFEPDPEDGPDLAQGRRADLLAERLERVDLEVWHHLVAEDVHGLRLGEDRDRICEPIGLEHAIVDVCSEQQRGTKCDAHEIILPCGLPRILPLGSKKTISPYYQRQRRSIAQKKAFVKVLPDIKKYLTLDKK